MPDKPFETEISTTTSGTLLGLAKRLPAIWRDRWRARKLAASLPAFEGTVAGPDSATIYSWLEEFCETPHRRPGTAEGHCAEQWVAGKLAAFGVEHVALDPLPITTWAAKEWSLKVGDEEVPCFYVVNSGLTGPEGTTAPLVYVGTGTQDNFARTDVAGKIVVADVPFPRFPKGVLMKLMRACYALSDPGNTLTAASSQYLNFVRQNFLGGTTAETAPKDDVYWQAAGRGARGICLILRDQPSNSNTHYGPYDGILKPMPGLWVGKYDGQRLRELAACGAEATLVLEGETAPGVTHNVWGVLPGQSDDVILVTSHHDSPFQGASEDGSGVVEVLAQAWAWSRVPKEQRPKTMIFVLDAGHFHGSIGAHAFAKAHTDIMERTRILITLEHLAAKDVEERARQYALTGNLALTVMFTTPDPRVIATVIKALDAKPPKLTAAIPADFFAPAPTSDAGGYVIEAGVPVISWIGCPYYLLDEHDTLDKIDRGELGPICETVVELVKTHMAIA